MSDTAEIKADNPTRDIVSEEIGELTGPGVTKLWQSAAIRDSTAP